MKSFVIGIACVLLLVSFVPLVTAQEEQPMEQPPIIPPEAAEGISEIGMGPVISLVLDAIDTIIALGADVIDTLIAFVLDVIDTIFAFAYTTFSIYSIWDPILGFIGIIPIVGFLATWFKGIARVLLCISRYILFVGWFLRLWDFIKLIFGPIPLV